MGGVRSLGCRAGAGGGWVAAHALSLCTARMLRRTTERPRAGAVALAALQTPPQPPPPRPRLLQQPPRIRARQRVAALRRRPHSRRERAPIGARSAIGQRGEEAHAAQGLAGPKQQAAKREEGRRQDVLVCAAWTGGEWGRSGGRGTDHLAGVGLVWSGRGGPWALPIRPPVWAVLPPAQPAGAGPARTLGWPRAPNQAARRPKAGRPPPTHLARAAGAAAAAPGRRGSHRTPWPRAAAPR